MITLTIGNSKCQISGLPKNHFDAVRNLLSYKIDARQSYFTGGHRSNVRNLMDKRGVFPSGLLHLVEQYCRHNSLEVLTNDTRRCPEPRDGLLTLSLPHTPYPEQIEASEICAEAHRGTISAVTGFGKSTTAALLIRRLQVPTLVVVPTVELRNQLTESLRLAFGVSAVGRLHGATWTPIAVENVDALKLDTPVKDRGCLIIDEAHHVAASTYRKLNARCWNDIYYRFFFTATPFRSREEEQMLMESISGRVVYTVAHEYAVSKGYIVPLEAYYFEVPKIKLRGGPTSYPAVYKALVVENEGRNSIIAHLVRGFSSGKSNHSVLTLVREINHGETLSGLTGHPFANGERDDCKELIRQFSRGSIKSLIGTTGVVGEGVDTRAAEYIILAGLGKSKNSIMQQIGRGFRNFTGKESCKVILFKDDSHKWTREHFKAQCKILRDEYGIKPSKLEL